MAHGRSPVPDHSFSRIIKSISIFIFSVIIPVTAIYYRFIPFYLSSILFLPFYGFLQAFGTNTPKATRRHRFSSVYLSIQCVLQGFNSTNFNAFGRILPRKVIGIANFKFICLRSRFSCYQNNAKRSFWTINRRWSCIFQYGNRLDIIGINHLNTWNFHVIQQNKRSIISRNGSNLTANFNQRVRTDFSRWNCNINTRHWALKSTTDIRNRTTVQCFIYVDCCNCTC